MNLPMLPLKIIFFPGETVPLHIFEDRYKQLIYDCRNEAVTFGIPVYINGAIKYGTEVQLVEVVNSYEGGEMDVICVARQAFKLLTFDTKMENKPYAGGSVQFIANENDVNDSDKIELLDRIQELYHLMEVPFEAISIEKFNSYKLIHKIGLSFEQEYKLLQMAKESERYSYIKNHLINTIAVLREVDRTKKIIKLNGDFKNFDPLDFDGFSMN